MSSYVALWVQQIGSSTNANTRGVIGTNDVVSGSKIQPLDAGLKENVSHDEALSGSVGTDHDIDQSKIPPLGPSTTRGESIFHRNNQRLVLA